MMVPSGKIQTVLGVVMPEDVGITYPHEHLSMDFSFTLQSTADPRITEKQDAGFDLKNLGWIRQYPYSHKPNLRYNDGKRAIVGELKQFKKYGGSGVVENSTVGLQRDIQFVRQASQQSGVHVIAGTGFYVDESLSPAVHQMSTEKMAETMIRDITEGTDNTDIKCGVIGELGCSWPLTATERRVLEAGAHVQTALGCPVIIHPGRGEGAPMEIVRILQEAGGKVDKTVMSHLDRTIFSQEKLRELADTGIYCELDLFGIEVSYYQFNKEVNMPSDSTRINNIKYLIDEGFREQVVIAHDCHTLHRLEQYGGHGLCHILLNVVPMMKLRGISQSAIDNILIDNPRRWLTFL
ncbi:phosphotriesterase-related protein-like [Liolophura sinensis]|uniref:phosphotriesterase-related protein-like n=1 Tax=Liolophura sinensis TaxID=3198878 RepID=UPI0031585517